MHFFSFQRAGVAALFSMRRSSFRPCIASGTEPKTSHSMYPNSVWLLANSSVISMAKRIWKRRCSHWIKSIMSMDTAMWPDCLPATLSSSFWTPSLSLKRTFHRFASIMIWHSTIAQCLPDGLVALLAGAWNRIAASQVHCWKWLNCQLLADRNAEINRIESFCHTLPATNSVLVIWQASVCARATAEAALYFLKPSAKRRCITSVVSWAPGPIKPIAVTMTSIRHSPTQHSSRSSFCATRLKIDRHRRV